MSSLKEIRGRIGSVKGTLKITSAMRMISSAKLQAAINAIGGMVPYERELGAMLGKLISRCPDAAEAMAKYTGQFEEDDFPKGPSRVAVVLVTSNQSLCGAFNNNIIRTFLHQSFDPSLTDAYAIGRIGLKALRKNGYQAEDCSAMASQTDYAASCALAEKLVKQFMEGRLEKVVLVYTHMVSKSTQIPTVKTYLPFVGSDGVAEGVDDGTEYIVEPSAREIIEKLLPQALSLKFHTALMDAAAAEHAARALAMQMATENADELIGELSLQYNKLRQQQITNEILDLVGGQAR